MLNHLLSRWKRSPSLLQASTLPADSRHAEGARLIKPRGPDSLLQSLMRLLPSDADGSSRPMAAATLAGLRAEFVAALHGVPDTQELRRSIQRARDRDDFWHLRGWLFTELARAHSQREAETRLARVNSHFDDSVDTFFRPRTNRSQ